MSESCGNLISQLKEGNSHSVVFGKRQVLKDTACPTTADHLHLTEIDQEKESAVQVFQC